MLSRVYNNRERGRTGGGRKLGRRLKKFRHGENIHAQKIANCLCRKNSGKRTFESGGSSRVWGGLGKGGTDFFSLQGETWNSERNSAGVKLYMV